jgi:hypothetical protein
VGVHGEVGNATDGPAAPLLQRAARGPQRDTHTRAAGAGKVGEPGNPRLPREICIWLECVTETQGVSCCAAESVPR